jgi:ribokinase
VADAVAALRPDVVLASLEVPIDAVQAAFRARAVRILNPAPFRALPADLMEADWLVPNESEATQIDAPADRTIVTLGARGVRFGGEVLPSIPVRAVDTTGAGDCFCGVFAAGLAEGLDPRSAVERAQIAAAICVTRHGAQESMPGRDEVQR